MTGRALPPFVADAEFTRLPDLASRRLGGAVIDANDDFFGDRAALVVPGPVQPRADFGYRGKLYDGWEPGGAATPATTTRSSALASPGSCTASSSTPRSSAATTRPRSPCRPRHWRTTRARRSSRPPGGRSWWRARPAKGHTANVYDVTDRHRYTHVRLTIHPDGGVARFRVHGEAVVDPRHLRGTVDLAAQDSGGLLVGCSDMFFSSPQNLLLPGPARSMSEGWETARRRDGGNDWVVVALAGPSRLRDVVFDTGHFLGNAPGAVQISGTALGPFDVTDLGEHLTDHLVKRLWTPLVARRPVRPDTPHRPGTPGRGRRPRRPRPPPRVAVGGAGRLRRPVTHRPASRGLVARESGSGARESGSGAREQACRDLP